MYIHTHKHQVSDRCPETEAQTAAAAQPSDIATFGSAPRGSENVRIFMCVMYV